MKRDPLPTLAYAGVATKSSTWRIALISLAIVLAFIVAAFWGTGAGMVEIWTRSETFAHGFVVAPISLWLIWRMRDRLRTLEPHPSWIVLPLMAAAGFAWLLGEVGAVNALAQFAFVSMLVLAVPAVLGLRLAREMLFPLGFLFFSVPIGEFLLPTLMQHTADFTVAALRLSGVPVYREGLRFVVPNGEWSIVEACSGVRYLIASLVVGTLFAYLTYTTIWRRLAFVAVSIAVPIVANWLRAYMIVMLGYISDNKIATGVDHIIYGWLFFGLVMLVMFWIGSRWQQRASRSNATPDVAPVTLSTNVSPPSHVPSRFVYAVVAAVVLAVVAFWPLANLAIERDSLRKSAALARIDVPGWGVTPAGPEAFQPHFVNPSAAQSELLRKEGRVVGLYVGYYRGQNTDHKLVTSDNVLLRSDDKTWHAISAGRHAMQLGGTTVPAVRTRMRSTSGETIETRQWYWINGTLTASDALAKARIAWLKVTGRSDDSAVVVIYTPVTEDVSPDQSLQFFATESWPSIEAALVKARGAAE